MVKYIFPRKLCCVLPAGVPFHSSLQFLSLLFSPEYGFILIYKCRRIKCPQILWFFKMYFSSKRQYITCNIFRSVFIFCFAIVVFIALMTMWRNSIDRRGFRFDVILKIPLITILWFHSGESYISISVWIGRLIWSYIVTFIGRWVSMNLIIMFLLVFCEEYIFYITDVII